MSAHSLALIEVNDSDTTVTTRQLFSNGAKRQHYAPSVQADQNGVVVETIDLLFEPYGGSTALEIIDEVTRLLEQAHTYAAKRQGNRIFLSAQLMGAAEAKRSPVLWGEVSWGEDTLFISSSGYVQATIILRRAAYWESDEASLGSGSIVNNGTASVTLSAPDGTMNAPVRVEVSNTFGAVSVRRLMLAIQNHTTYSPLYLPGGTRSWSTTQTYNNNLDRWHTYNFTKNQLVGMAGEEFVVLVGLSSHTGQWYMQACVYADWGVTPNPKTWTDEALVSGPGIVVLGTVAIPPSGTSYGVGSGSGDSDIKLALNVRSDSSYPSVSGSYAIEWIMLMPKPLRVLHQSGYDLANNDVWVDDGIREIAYVQDVSESVQRQVLKAKGGPLVVIPGKAGKLRCVIESQGADVDPTITADVEVFYRPRWRLL